MPVASWVRSHARAGVRVTLELMVGGGARRSQCSPRRRIRRGNVSSAVRVLSNRLVGFQWGISTSHDPRTDPDAPTRFLSRAERGSAVRGSDRSSVSRITNRRIDSAKASRAIESAETDPTRWNFAPGFQAAGRRARRNSYGQTVSLDRISIESTAREARSAARADSDARIPNPRDRSQPEKTPRAGPRGDADALAEGTASSRARDAQRHAARGPRVVFSADDTR